MVVRFSDVKGLMTDVIKVEITTIDGIVAWLNQQDNLNDEQQLYKRECMDRLDELNKELYKRKTVEGA